MFPEDSYSLEDMIYKVSKKYTGLDTLLNDIKVSKKEVENPFKILQANYIFVEGELHCGVFIRPFNDGLMYEIIEMGCDLETVIIDKSDVLVLPSNGRVYQCSKCNRLFLSSRMNPYILKDEHGNKPFSRCPLCGKIYRGNPPEGSVSAIADLEKVGRIWEAVNKDVLENGG